MLKAERVRVGDVLKLRRSEVGIDPFREYTLIGVYSFGKGIFHRQAIPGTELGDYRFFEVHPGDLVLSNIQAWEGAIAYASDADCGTIGTHRFLTYTARNDRIDTNWARYFFLSQAGFEMIQLAAPGTVKRNRTLAIDRFENLFIPLPELDEQRRIADNLERTLTSVRTFSIHADQSVPLDEVLVQSSIDELLSSLVSTGWDTRPLGELAQINPSPSPRPTAGSVAFVPMSSVDHSTGTIDSFEIRSIDELATGYKQFLDGDIIFARITPCMQNGKAALIQDLPTNVAYGSTEFHVIRPVGSVSSTWIHRIVRTRSFREQAAAHFKGTAGQQRVPANFLHQVRIPTPPNAEEEERVLATIDQLLNKLARLRELRRQASILAKAYHQSALNRAFAGLM